MNKPASIPRSAAKRWIKALGLSLILWHLSFSHAVAQQSVEYWIDSDPGLGFATILDGTFSGNAPTDFSATIDVSGLGLAPGYHQLGFRAIDRNSGIPCYSPTLTQSFYLPLPPKDEAQLAAVEYWIDTDPGLGLGTQITGNAATIENFTVDVNGLGLAPGYHQIGFRAISYCGGKACYSPTLTQSFYLPLPPKDEAQLAAVEYWIDSDPGLGLGTQITGNAATIENFTVDVNGLGLAPGYHQIGFRAISYCGGKACYSPTLTQSFYLPIAKGEVAITHGEYFWGPDPGYGKGTPIAVTSGSEFTIEDLKIPSHSVHGDAMLFIRFLGTEGWSPTVACRVMVDAEGNYTLNAQAETSMEQRNYQTLAEAVGDFAERGISDDIVLTLPTKNTVYELKATGDSCLAQLEQVAQNLDAISTAADNKTIAFKAAAATGNSLSVTTTDEGLPTVVAFLAHTSLENIALTINGTAYNFTPAALRHEETCGTTSPVPLSSISTAIAATWQAQPHAGSVIGGFPADGSGDLPAITLTNSGPRLDSLAYHITLSDTDGHDLCSYTYHIYVHARMENQAFTALSPATGSTIDPVPTTLQWNAFGDAVAYRLTVKEIMENGQGEMENGQWIMDNEEATVVVNTETDRTQYELNVKPGYIYAWIVTAIGHCDELESPTMTFKGRLLPDLAVTAITMPEVAEAGNKFTATATIANQGEDATTEGKWTDRLYYAVNSDDFANAVQAAEVKHTGNLAAGETYDVTFTMSVPYLEEGNLHIFVVTDTEANVLEADDTNNRTLATTSATLQPFYMNTIDLAALRKLYTDFDGDNWSGTPWNTASELIAETNWSGITFNPEGRVTAINLQKRGLKGTLDVANIETMQDLKKLNLSYNSIDSMTAALPSTLTSVDLRYQNIETSVSLKDMLEHNAALTALLPNIVTYNSANRTFAFNGYFQLTNTLASGSQTWRMDITDGTLQQTANPTVIYNEADGWQVRMRVNNGSVWNDMRLIVDFEAGDANLDGWRNVADLQHLVNFVVNDTHTKVFFNFKAADLQPDGAANVLDVVRLVNLLLDDADDSSEASVRRRMPRRAAPAEAEALLILRGQELVLVSSRPVAAFDICLHTEEDAHVEWLPYGSGLQWSQRNGYRTSHAIAYSMDEEVLPAGQTVLARIYGGTAAIGTAMLVDAEAKEVSFAVMDWATDIDAKAVGDGQVEIYSVDGIKHQNTVQHKGIYIVNGKKTVVK